MGRLYVEMNINGKPSIYTIEVLAGELVVLGSTLTRYSLGYAIRENVSYTEAFGAFMKNPADVVPLLKETVKVIGG